MGWAARARFRAVAAEKCATCAYRPGTDASRDDDDPLLAKTRKALLEAAQPFFCHERRVALCTGHMDAMRVLDAQGFYQFGEDERQRRVDHAADMVAERNRLHARDMARQGGTHDCGEWRTNANTCALCDVETHLGR